jgi:hypothetical protein
MECSMKFSGDQRFILLVLLLLLPFTPVFGSGSSQITFSKLLEEADAIVVGKCVNVRYSWNDKMTLIYTEATYEVTEWLRTDGTPTQQIVVSEMGGTVGRITQALIGGPRFAESQQSVLLLNKKDGQYRIFGLRRGQLPVVESKKGKHMVLLPRTGDGPKPPGETDTPGVGQTQLGPRSSWIPLHSLRGKLAELRDAKGENR